MNPLRQRHDPLKNLVGFMVGDVRYALPIRDVKEIVNPLVLVPLPNAAHAVEGVADYRGEVVPVVDLRVRFGLVVSPATRRTKWILVDVGGRRVALVVDAVTEVFGATGELRPPPTLGGGEDLRAIAGVTSVDKQMIFVLAPTRFAELTAPMLAAGSLAADAGGS